MFSVYCRLQAPINLRDRCGVQVGTVAVFTLRQSRDVLQLSSCLLIHFALLALLSFFVTRVFLVALEIASVMSFFLCSL